MDAKKKVLLHFSSGPIQARQNHVSGYPFLNFLEVKIDPFPHSLDVNQEAFPPRYKCNPNGCKSQVCQWGKIPSLQHNTSQHVENKSKCKQFLNWSQCLYMGLCFSNNDLGHKAVNAA